MRLDEFESSQPEVGDILEIEIGNELVETVIVGINRGHYIVESTSTDLLESQLDEIDRRGFLKGMGAAAVAGAAGGAMGQQKSKLDLERERNMAIANSQPLSKEQKRINQYYKDNPGVKTVDYNIDPETLTKFANSLNISVNDLKKSMLLFKNNGIAPTVNRLTMVSKITAESGGNFINVTSAICDLVADANYHSMKYATNGLIKLKDKLDPYGGRTGGVDIIYQGQVIKTVKTTQEALSALQVIADTKIRESVNQGLAEGRLNEVNPHNYDSDWDYYDAVKRSGRRRNSDDYEPADSGPTDDDVHYAKQQAQAKTAPVQKQSDNDGQAPNGERYNTVVTFTSADNNRNKIAADSYKDYHWGAKKVVDSKQDNGVFTLYVVDNHKHGMWKPWRDQPAEGMAEEFNGEYDDEAGMAQSNLRTMARAVDGLIDTIKDNDNLPEWAQEKLAKAEMMTTGVWDYLLSQKEQGMDPKVQGVSEEKQRLDAKCWTGYKKQGTKMKGDTRVNNCVKESLEERTEKKEKIKVYVKNPKTGRVVKVDFGEPGQLIKKSKKHRKHGKKRWNLKK